MTTATRHPSASAGESNRPADDPLIYQSGFGNEFVTEALDGAVPVGQNSPQRVPYGLYAEQISGTAFTAPRGANRRSWTYRIRPAAMHRAVSPRSATGASSAPLTTCRRHPTSFAGTRCRCRRRRPISSTALVTMAGNGDPAAMSGCGIHLYAANRSMTDRFFYDADGELLIVPQQGRLRFATELGRIDVEPQEIVVIPRGVRFRVELPDDTARGYVCENYGALAASAGSRRHRHQRPRQSARLPHAARMVRGPRRRLRARRRSSWATCGRRRSTTRRSTSSAGTATTRRTSTTCAASTRSARSASTIPIRRSSSCCSRQATRRAWTRSTS